MRADCNPSTSSARSRCSRDRHTVASSPLSAARLAHRLARASLRHPVRRVRRAGTTAAASRVGMGDHAYRGRGVALHRLPIRGRRSDVVPLKTTRAKAKETSHARAPRESGVPGRDNQGSDDDSCRRPIRFTTNCFMCGEPTMSVSDWLREGTREYRCTTCGWVETTGPAHVSMRY
jgi:predicted RNA-binding Zn-ribbon protein involved in translation (DUF1610 family)